MQAIQPVLPFIAAYYSERPIRLEFSDKQTLSYSGKYAIIGKRILGFLDHCDFPVAENWVFLENEHVVHNRRMVARHAQ